MAIDFADLKQIVSARGRRPPRPHATSTIGSTTRPRRSWRCGSGTPSASRFPVSPRSSCGRRAAAPSSTGGSDGRDEDGSRDPALPRGLGRALPGRRPRKTPGRVAKAWIEDLVSGYAVDPVAELTSVAALERGGPVLAKDIRFASGLRAPPPPVRGVGARRVSAGGAAGGLVEARTRRGCALAATCRSRSISPGASPRPSKRALAPKAVSGRARRRAHLHDPAEACARRGAASSPTPRPGCGRKTSRRGARSSTCSPPAGARAPHERVTALSAPQAPSRRSRFGATLVVRVAQAAPGDDAVRAAAAAANPPGTLYRVGLDVGHRLMLSSDRPYRLVDPSSGQAGLEGQPTRARSPCWPRADRRKRRRRSSASRSERSRPPKPPKPERANAGEDVGRPGRRALPRGSRLLARARGRVENARAAWRRCSRGSETPVARGSGSQKRPAQGRRE